MDNNYVFALDVDGVLTDGKFLWDAEGNKAYKEFGPDDADALKILARYMPVVLFSKDGKGYKISESRANHMGFPIYYMDTQERLDFIAKVFGVSNAIYMGDSFMDVPVLKLCKYGIATDTSSPYAKEAADYVTTTGGGNRAVAEACFWIMKNVLKMNSVELITGASLELDNKPCELKTYEMGLYDIRKRNSK